MEKKRFLTLVLIIGITVQSWSQLSVLNLQTGTPPADVLRSIGLSANQYTQLVNAAGGGYAGWRSSAGGFTMWWAGRSESNRLAVENRLQRERIPSNRFTLYRQESHGAASDLRYYEEGELSLSFVHQDTSLIASLLAGTYNGNGYNTIDTISFSGNRFAARTSDGYFTGTVTIIGKTFTLTEHNSRDNWLTGKWEIIDDGYYLQDPDGSWWECISDTVAERPQNLSQAHRLFIERVGQMHAYIFSQDRFTWNNANELLTFKSRGRDFTGTDWGFIHSPISFYKEMEVYFLLGNIIYAQWRYVYTSADPWFQIGGSPSVQNPLRSIWFSTAVPNNNVIADDWRGGGVINTLVHFESLGVGAKYTFRRGEGSNTTLTVKAVE
jgi:hypothetical protein